ncbi:MAG: hypothetical protein LUG60_14250 [Erysipelotrichaceae bacterium]|nr:hypothetical protein [Erysipelotrichaceae bacterium]
MKKLTLQEQYNLIGGTCIRSAIIYAFFKKSLYQIIKSTSGKILIPKIISAEWK